MNEKYFYSKSSGGFYLQSIHGDPAIAGGAIPNDYCEIEKDVYEQLLVDQTKGKRIVGDSDDKPVAVDVNLPISDIRNQQKKLIDRIAGSARFRLLNSSDAIEVEYDRVYHQAVEFIANGGAVPMSIQSYVDTSGLSVTDAANKIISTAESWFVNLDVIRDIRLKGKAAIDAALDTDNMSDVATPYIDQLNAITA